MMDDNLIKLVGRAALPVISLRRSIQTVGPLIGHPNVEIRIGSNGTKPTPLAKLVADIERTCPKIQLLTVIVYDFMKHLESIKWLLTHARDIYPTIIETDGVGLNHKTVLKCTQLIVTPKQFNETGTPLDVAEAIALAKYEHVHYRFLIDGIRALDYLKKLTGLIEIIGRNPITLTPSGVMTLTSLREAIEGWNLPNVLLLPEARTMI